MIKKYLVSAVLVFIFSTVAFSATPAFPTAEGYGMYATGGRGGRVVEVTNLLDDANGVTEGSLRWALKQYSSEPLTVVFRVSGIINLVTDLRSSRTAGTTWAGQTAPGDGICIRGAKVNLGGSKNMIIRHIRFRIGLKNDITYTEGGSIGIENAENWIIDHCTFGWSCEENMTIYDNKMTTIQWCLVHEGLYSAGHPKGDRGYGCQWGGQTCTFHHNLLAHNYNRSPRVNGARSNDLNVKYDYVNNVNYNWGKPNSSYGADFDASGRSHVANWVNNYYKPGPALPGTSSSYFIQASFNADQNVNQIAKFYMSGNFMEGSANIAKNSDNSLGLDASYYTAKGVAKSALISTTPFEVLYPVKTQTAAEAYLSVLAGAGAFPRDTVDRRIINEVRTGTASGSGKIGTNKGIIDKPSAVGGYPEYKTYNAITDNDHDGMDDAWETAKGLDPNNANDRNTLSSSGYTALEVYLNSLVGENIDFGPNDIIEVSNTGIGIYPNPVVNTINIISPESIRSYSIFDISGKFLSKNFGDNIRQVNVTSLVKGSYFLVLNTAENKTANIRFIK
jgi:pectate lyase